MKKLLSIAILLICGSVAAQTFGNAQDINYNVYKNNVNLIDSETRDAGIVGSRYINDEWNKATVVSLKDNSTANFYARVDAYQNNIEISEDSNGKDAVYLIKSSNYIINLNGKKYIYLENTTDYDNYEGFAVLMKELKQDAKIVEVYNKQLQTPAVEVNNGYNTSRQKKRFVDSSTIYFVYNNKLVEIENHKRRIYRNLDDDKQKELKKFIKKNDLDFEDDYAAATKVLNYYISLNSFK